MEARLIRRDSSGACVTITDVARMSGHVRWQILAFTLSVSTLCYGIAYLLRDADEAGRHQVPARNPTTAVPAAPAGTAAAGTAATQAGRAPARDEAEVCGLGVIKTGPRDRDGSAHIPGALRKDAERIAIGALLASTDSREQASGLLLQAKAAQRGGSPDKAAIGQLAQMAAHTADPLVYAAALEACGAHRFGAAPSAACTTLNTRQWARIDPGNAAPWLRLAQESLAMKDEAGLAEAVYQVAQANTLDWHANDAATIAMQALPRTISPLQRAVMVHEAWDMQSTWTLPSYRGLSAFCEASGDVNRAQLCDAAATLLVGTGGTHADLRLGMRIGRILGWDEQRLEHLHLQRDVLSRALARVPFHDQPYSCASIDELQKWALLQRRLGELGAARNLLESSGQSLQAEAIASKRKRKERLTSADYPR
jgi:hypothetical protein